MSLYAIGDVQGCDDALHRLLLACSFHRSRDRLWFVGDLVNRGPDSLGVLRRVRDLGDRATVVLGNHDLHLLARAAGVARPRPDDTLDGVLAAADLPELIGWLSSRPLLHREGDFVLVHAGLPPRWNIAEAEQGARRAERALRGTGAAALLAELRGPLPEMPRSGDPAATIAALTRIRLCDSRGRLLSSLEATAVPAGGSTLPWFRVPGRRSRDATVVFGHWAALGGVSEHGLLGLDTGCVWGGRLTAVRVEDGSRWEVPCAPGVRPA